MMNEQQAVKAINRLVEATSLVVKQLNSTRGVSKTAKTGESKAAKALFIGLTSSKPTDEQVEEMTYI